MPAAFATEDGWVRFKGRITTISGEKYISAGDVRPGYRTPLRRCEKCGALRLSLVGPHAPRMQHDGTTWRELDCVGDEVRAS